MSEAKIKAAFLAGFIAGFRRSAEGFNAEYPYYLYPEYSEEDLVRMYGAEKIAAVKKEMTEDLKPYMDEAVAKYVAQQKESENA